MGFTLQGETVLLFGRNRDVAEKPVVQLGLDASSVLRPILVGPTGAISTTLGEGTAIVGKFGIDQTTPGTTNGVQLVAPIPAGTNTIGSVRNAQSSAVPSSFAIRTANETVFTLAAGERGFIQNLDTDTLLVKYGAGAAADSFNFVLKASTGAADGSGGYLEIENWTGVVSVFASTGTASYLAWKI